MINPYSRIPHAWVVTVVALVATAIVAWLMTPSLALLRTPEAPKRIASLELARDAESARKVIDSWKDGGIEAAKTSIRLDCLFIPAYSTLLAFIWFGAAHWLRGRVPGLPTFVTAWGWAMWGAGILDYVENWCDYRMIEHGATDSLARISSVCATVKFVVTLVLIKTLF